MNSMIISRNALHIFSIKSLTWPGAGGCRLPVILATWETEIRRISVQDQSRENVSETTSQPIAGRDGVHLSSQLWEAEIKRLEVLGQPRQKSLQDRNNGQ
jgi:hypothetical protein